MGWPGMFLTKCHLEGIEPWDYHQGRELQGAGGVQVQSPVVGIYSTWHI